MLSIEYSKAFDAGREGLIDSLVEKRPSGYADLLERTIRAVNEHYEDSDLDPDRITRIDHGDYQGTLLFIVGGTGYQPFEHFATKVGYGSCSYCDAFEACDDKIDRYDDDGNEVSPNRTDCEGYVGLCLNMFQSLKPV